MRKVNSYDKFFSVEEKEQIKKDYIENALSIKNICKKYSIGSTVWVRKLLGDKIRNFSESGKIAHIKYSDRYKLSEEAKDKIRKARLEWMKKHPEQTAWRQKNMSYPEKCFKKILEDNGLDKKYLIYREYSVFPYFIDYAFVNEKLAVEIDGSQHLEEDRKNRDEKKDALLISKGWRVLRIAAIEVTHDGSKALKSVLDMLDEPVVQYNTVGILKAPKTRTKSCFLPKKKVEKTKKVGILRAPKIRKKVVRGEDGLSDGERLRAFNQRKVERPSKEELSKLLQESNFSAIGKAYGVSDNSIRKWCKAYDLPHRKKDMK